MKRRTLVYILIAPLLAYAGLKSYVWYTIKNGVDDAIASVAPFVEIRYDGIFSTLGGEVGIEGVYIKPVMTNDEFTLQSMSLSSESIFDFIDVGDRFNRQDFPKQVSANIQKLNLDLSSKIFQLMSDFQQQAESTQPADDGFLLERLDALGCGDVERFGLDEFIEMGYDQVELDLVMGMKYNDASQQMQINVQMKDRDLYRADFDVSFALDIDKVKAGTMDANELAVTAMNVVYDDMGYHILRNEFCAEQSGGTTETYIDANVAQISTELGGTLPEKVVAAYRGFMTNGGTIKMNISPAEAVELSGMQFYETADAMRMMGMSITVNDVSVDAEQIQWKTAGTKPDAKSAGRQVAKTNMQPSRKQTRSSSEANLKSAPASTAKDAQQVNTKTIKVSQLSRYIGKMVQVNTTKGKRRVGLLESIDDERVRILMKMGGGEFSFPVKIDEISSAEVLR